MSQHPHVSSLLTCGIQWCVAYHCSAFASNSLFRLCWMKDVVPVCFNITPLTYVMLTQDSIRIVAVFFFFAWIAFIPYLPNKGKDGEGNLRWHVV